jgi:lipopolysaccharide/colanic/teichoic acid biosynthesis glycosyltransferase
MQIDYRHWIGSVTLKRIFDFVCVCFALPLICPVMAIIAFLIRATSNGPIFFRQDRVGLHQKIFRVYKFRTMVQGAEEMGTSVTTRRDPRITPIGRILRKLKLDELPQLINVFTGDMSLAGPRPDVPEIVENYTIQMRQIFQIRPGITSVATLHLRDEEEILADVDEPDTFYEDILVPLKVKLAMEHVERDSFAFDLKILYQTLWMLTLGRWWPIEEHSTVAKLRDKIEKKQARTTQRKKYKREST